jgi:CRP-like cAMP-binding protein
MGTPTADDVGSVELFAGLADADREIVAAWLDVEHVDPGRHLTHQGASGYAFFVLRSGSADVLVDGAVVRTMTPGDFFGELSMLGSGRQTATVSVTAPAEVWTMFGTRFRELQVQFPHIAATIEQTASSRKGSLTTGP